MATQTSAPGAADWGYLKNFKESYDFGRTLGRGGSGLVRVVRKRASGEEYACKTIRKDLREHNRELVRREVRCGPHPLPGPRPASATCVLCSRSC